MDYIVVFDIPQIWPGDLIHIAYALLICIIELKYRIISSRWRKYKVRKDYMSQIILVVVILFITYPITTYFYVKYELVSAYRKGEFHIVEGLVTNFVPVGLGGKGAEKFTVNGEQFRYSDHMITPAFNNTRHYGGPLHEGVQVRIWHVGNDIIRLEMKKGKEQ